MNTWDNSSQYSKSEIFEILSNDTNINKIKLCTWNVHSIKSANAFTNFKQDISGFVSKGVDFLLLTETWVEIDNNKFDPYKIENFNSIKCIRPKSTNKQGGGGVIIYVRSSYNYKVLRSVFLNHIEFVIVEISLTHAKFLLCCVYRPPNSDFDNFLLEFERILDFCANEQLIIGGDFNIDLFSNNSKTIQYNDLLSLYDVRFTNNAVTRIASKTLIDHVLTANLNNDDVITFTAEKMRSSDHNALITVVNLQPVLPLLQHSYTKRFYNYELLRNDFYNGLSEIKANNANLRLEELTCCIVNSIDLNSSVKTLALKSRNLMPEWADWRYFRMIKRIENIERKIVKLTKLCKPTSKLKAIQLRVKIALSSHNEFLAKNYYTKLIRNNPACSWVVVNEIIGKSSKVKSKITLSIGNTLVKDDQTIAEKFADYFCETVSNNDSVAISPHFIGTSMKNSMYFDPVSQDEVFETIMTLDAKKAAGSDSIPAKILKVIANELTAPLTELINMIVMTSTYPEQMKYAHVIPLFKGGDKNLPENYRGISILTILNKIVEKIILKRICNFVQHMKVDDKTQYGYRALYGTNDAIFKLVHNVSKALDMNDMLLVIFVDLSKAFDSISHKVLLHKLHCIGIRGFLYDLLESYLKDRFFSVKYGNCVSLIRLILKGVPQGAILAPMLFNISLIDMQNLNLQCDSIKYADDLLLFKRCNNSNFSEDMKVMGNDLMALNNYFTSNGLSINFAKTSFMIFKNANNVILPQEITTCSGIKIERISSQKYLGVIFDEKFDFNLQCDALINKLTDAVKAIRIIKHYLPKEALIQFFHAHFMSHIHYCSFIMAKFTKQNIMRIQRLQNWCVKLIFQLDKKHSTLDLYTNVINNTLPIIGIVYLSMLSFIKKSLIYSNELLPKYELNTNLTRLNGTLKVDRFKRKNRAGNETSCLGVKLFNQLPEEIRNLTSLKVFKKRVKIYLQKNVDILLMDDQFSNKRISK